MQVIDPKRIARLMVIEDVSQRELSAAAGWKSHSYLSRILKGEIATLTTERAERIADKLVVDPEVLFLPVVFDDTERTVAECAS